MELLYGNRQHARRARHRGQLAAARPAAGPRAAGTGVEQALGRARPAETRLGRDYVGPERLVVPTNRTALETREPLRLEAIVLGDAKARSVQLAWRVFGSGAWTTFPSEHVNRGVWRVSLAAPPDDFEYAVEAISGTGVALQVPAGGRDAPRTVVVVPR